MTKRAESDRQVEDSSSYEPSIQADTLHPALLIGGVQVAISFVGAVLAGGLVA
jgi:hypothetical protein